MNVESAPFTYLVAQLKIRKNCRPTYDRGNLRILNSGRETRDKRRDKVWT